MLSRHLISWPIRLYPVRFTGKIIELREELLRERPTLPQVPSNNVGVKLFQFQRIRPPPMLLPGVHWEDHPPTSARPGIWWCLGRRWAVDGVWLCERGQTTDNPSALETSFSNKCQLNSLMLDLGLLFQFIIKLSMWDSTDVWPSFVGEKRCFARVMTNEFSWFFAKKIRRESTSFMRECTSFGRK